MAFTPGLLARFFLPERTKMVTIAGVTGIEIRLAKAAIAIGIGRLNIQALSVRTKLAVTIAPLTLLLVFATVIAAAQGPADVPFLDAMAILLADVGLDVKYGITANLTADFTYNTDFA